MVKSSQNKQLIISADKSPQDLEGIEERMRSRLGWGLVADIHPLTYELRLGILQAKEEKLSASISPNILEFLAHKITSNVRELEGALRRVGANAKFTNREIDVNLIKESLKDLLAIQQRQISIENIQKTVSDYYNIRVSDLLSSKRNRSLARPRQVSMCLSKELTNHSLPEIGDSFGGRDHTTVLHACRRISALREEDADIADDYTKLIRTLTA